MVVHLSSTGNPVPPRVGFVVSAAVGNSVVRNRVKRRLRALAGHQLARLSPGTDVVVRALPASSASSYDDLQHAFDRSLTRVLAKSAS